MERIPENAPLVLRPSGGRLGLYYGLSILIIAILSGCGLLGLAAITDFNLGIAIIFTVIIAPFMLLTIGVLVWRVVATLRSGPTLAADAEGLWIHARKWPIRPQHLRWDEIAWIAVRQHGVDRSVCVMPRAELPAPNQDRRERNQMRRQVRDYGAPYTASLTWGDRPEAEVLASLTQLAAGRCQVALG